MKIVTKKEQEKIDAMAIKKLRFVAIATLRLAAHNDYLEDIPNGFVKMAQDRAEQVFYVDSVL